MSAHMSCPQSNEGGDDSVDSMVHRVPGEGGFIVEGEMYDLGFDELGMNEYYRFL